MTITALPSPPPTRSDPVNFDARADAMFGAFPTMITQMNATAAAVDASATAAAAAAATATASPATIASSTTSLSITAGSKTATIQSGKTIVADMWVVFVHHADPTIWMSGPVTSYSGTSLVVNVQNVSGSGGPFTDWTIYAIQPSMSAASPRALADGSTIAEPSGTPRAIGFKGLPLVPTAKTAAYTLALSDMGMCVPTNSGVTFPTYATVPLPIGDLYCVYNNSASAITLSPASGVTMRLEGTTTAGARTIGPYSKAFIHKVGTDEVIVGGTAVS